MKWYSSVLKSNQNTHVSFVKPKGSHFKVQPFLGEHLTFFPLFKSLKCLRDVFIDKHQCGSITGEIIKCQLWILARPGEEGMLGPLKSCQMSQCRTSTDL